MRFGPSTPPTTPAHVWYTPDGDVPGLSTEGETLGRAAAMLSGMVAANAERIAPERRERPHAARLVTLHESTIPVAA